MKDTLVTKLHRRELDDLAVRSRGHRRIYSDRRMIENLDIVNELDGHWGCVNTMSWSKSGRLLASGSDDQYLNIHAYQPSDSMRQFELVTSVATGHTQNIFSVKFMPHSNDNTLVTAAGDHEVRVFDLEYSGRAASPSQASSIVAASRRRAKGSSYGGLRYLTDGDTNARVYRSHSDRVKRIVTESSPYLFLTCSEDGTVRQFDTRQPSSTYPRHSGMRFDERDEGPPPLISYRRYGLDLNSISCSASQPHYIALGGAHLHAFLHDRRMTGRDKLKEMGKSVSPIHNLSDREQELLSQATLCVKKFAPRGQRDMKRGNHGHITALKISDARPSEMIVSWSGEHIYAFDLVGESQDNERNLSTSHKRAKESHDRKRKRRPEGSDASLAQVSSRQRTDSPSISGQDTALRITYQNGQSEEISLPHPAPLTETQRAARQMAKSTVKLCNSLFQPSREDCESNAAFTKTLGHAALVLDEIEHVVWGYPMDPDAEQVQTEQTFRRTRESTRQFVQASGTLSRALGGTLDSEMTAQFLAIETRRSHLAVTLREQFCYDFLKSILLWLESGVGQLIEAFTRPADMSPSSKAASRLPIPANEATSEALDDILIPYLLQLASDRPIVNLEANRFETAENRMLFATEKAAVLAFAAAVRIPFEDLSAAIVLSEDSERVHAQDRQTAHRYWARKVGRGILFNVAEGLSFAAVDRAFGGVGKTPRHVAELETELRELAINRHDGQDGPMAGVSNSMITAGDHDDLGEREHTGDSEAIETDDDVLISSEDDAGDDGGDDDETHPDSSSEDDRDEFLPYPGGQQFLFCSALDRRQVRPTVEPHVDCARPIRPPYRGHLNARTVKDVNYIGGDDEYVVSGSDDGNVFIWDSKTSKLINILEGDCEVVNVVQGHPYEPMLAVSGIDSTIKIFSPDGRARANARRGDNINVDVPTDIKQVPTEYARQHSPGSEPATPASYDGSDDDDRVELNGLASRKRMWELASIMEMNEEQRQGHNQDDPLVSVNAHLVQFLMRNGLIQ